MAMFSELTEEQQKNFCTLRDYIKDFYGDQEFNENFNMDYCCKNEGFIERNPARAVCGTSCCVLGHGPQAGIFPNGILTWSDYAFQKFGQDSCELDSSWDFLFHENWADNIQFAIWRLDQYINGRDVEGFTFEDINDEYFNDA